MAPISIRSLVLLATALVSVSAGKIFTSPSQVTKKYDFIVVGGGTAGSVIAARLSEVASVNVLVIEAGGLDNTTFFDAIYTPLLAGSALGTDIDWQYTSVPQPGLNGRTVNVPRGKVLGGCSAINGMIYARGSADEYNRLATVSGDAGWSWKNLKSYMLKNEQHSPPWNGRSNVGQYDPAWHGNGPLLTGLTPQVFELDNRVMANTRTVPNAFPFNLDPNSGVLNGVSWLETTVGNGMRSTSASKYLHPAVNTRSNLDVLINTQVTKLVQTASKTFRGVQVAQGAQAASFSFTASKEVILSAGSIGTPQLLLLSGIGPSAQLRPLGIPTVLDNPDVGRNLQDQTILNLQWEVNPAFSTLSAFFANATAFGGALAEWQATHTGFAAGNTVVNTIAFLRLPNNSPLLANRPDPAAGPGSPHFQMAFLNLFLGNPGQAAPASGSFNTVALVLQSPTTVGSVNITSSSAFAKPAIDNALLGTSFDIGTMVAAARTAQAFFSTPAFAGYFVSPAPETAAALASDAALTAYIRKYADSIKHPVGTARISKGSDRTGVVDGSLLVKGLTGVRVVDASVLPLAPASFPQGEVYILAERAADIVKKAWNLH
ncbi:Aryl-alcohol oxidase-like protein [Mycena indigotica]|uniref:Aryl-alcohol oxidase-like protein n=1 Tax=Mycena indigotica TaxID=2126181 RepID=A0A8H6SEI4_9AGAR|nr:Aryl-alcohol oxidase-like protein [Mycena indigotica]KAF7296877.1 Aryl-alcohol oxidase-like protein [Mycena indigotica]